LIARCRKWAASIFAAHLKANPTLTSAPILMLTSPAFAGRGPCRELGIAGYLTKPIKQSELMAAILRVLGAPATKRRRQNWYQAQANREPPKPQQFLVAEDNAVNAKLASRLLEKQDTRSAWLQTAERL